MNVLHTTSGIHVVPLLQLFDAAFKKFHSNHKFLKNNSSLLIKKLQDILSLSASGVMSSGTHEHLSQLHAGVGGVSV